MSVYALIFSSLGIGCIIGMCAKIWVFPDQFDADSESDVQLSDYVTYLENMLDSSTSITTESVQLHTTDANCSKITHVPVEVIPITRYDFAENEALYIRWINRTC
jgi:hypothetical protein